MNNLIMEKLNSVEGGKYSFLKLSSVAVSKKDGSAELSFVYPQDRILSAEDKNSASDCISKIVGTKLQIRVKFVKGCFFEDYFKDELIAFFQKYPSVSNYISKEDILIEKKGDVVGVVFVLPEVAFDYASNANFAVPLKKMFMHKYYEVFDFGFEKKSGDGLCCDAIEKFVKKSNGDALFLENGGTRAVTVENREEFIGDIIYDDATYISDARICDSIILCGKIDNFTVLLRKPKTPEDTEERKFFKFQLKDFTGAISCIYFPTKKTENLIMNLCDGKSIIAGGKVVSDNYREGQLTFNIRNISLCTLPAQFEENRLMRKVNDEYIAVIPQPYIKPTQASFLETPLAPPVSLEGKRFCVFDIETTGLSPERDDIIELGAVIVENGSIKETFSSFVSTAISLPAKIIELTGITDGDLVGSPSVKDVLSDFYKFSYGMPLVGQNVGFDYGFVSVHGAKHHIYFDNERIDTIVLARKYLKDMKKFTLDNITEKLGVKNEGAHRALNDAVATAEVFVKLSRIKDDTAEI